MRLLFLVVLLVGALATKPQLQPWADVDLGHAVQEGAADYQYLWLLGTQGTLVRFDRQSGERTTIGRDFFDLQGDGNRLWAAARDESSDSVSLHDLKNPMQPPLVVEVSDAFVGLFATGADRPGLLTTRQVLMPEGDGWRRHALAAELQCAEQVAADGHIAAGANGQIYFGCEMGEWGGGLQRIDLATGAASVISQPSDELSGGLLNPRCDPVVGVFPDHRQPDCMTVGTSLAHLGGLMGQILRVCGDQITPVFSDRVGSTPRGHEQTWPFDQLVPTQDGWIAVSQRRYARSRSGAVEMHSTPHLRNWSGLRISDEQDGVLFVLRACCWGVVDNPTEFSVLAVPIVR